MLIVFARRLHLFYRGRIPTAAALLATLHYEIRFVGRDAARRRISCAEWLGTIDDRGTVVVGKRADLLLLEGNPLADIKNTRRIAAVIVSGKLYSRNELNARLD